jgi:predicted GNAT superfamily acetyltransferase
LVRRNAYFNLVKLGAAVVSFHPSFYGVMSDGLNAGDESDRMLVRWEIDVSPAAAPSTSLAALSAIAPCHLEVDADQHPIQTDRADDVFTCDVPDDLALLRRTAPGLALEWRVAFRETVGAAMANGFQVLGFTRSNGYLLGAPALEAPRPRRGTMPA